MPADGPLVSIGVPVYQGENYLDDTLQALRDQSYENLDIVVSDNASTDSTPKVIAEHAAADGRIRSVTQSENLGAAENYNVVFRMAGGEYFAWNAHDDLTTRDFVGSAVEALRAVPDAVLAVARPFRVGPDLAKLEELAVPKELESDDPAVRFRAAARTSPAGLIFGLFPRDVLEKTGLHGHFAGSDRNLVAEVMLHGRLVWAGTSEFYLREHAARSVRSHRGVTERRFSHARDAWYAPERKGRLVFPNWHRVGHYIGSVSRAPLGMADRARCYLTIVRLLGDDSMVLLKMMGFDLVTAGFYVMDRLKMLITRRGDTSSPTR